LQNPIVREAFFPTTDHLYSIENAAAGDERAIKAIAERHLTSSLAAVIDAWWRLAPGAFRVLRDRQSSVAGFYLICEAEDISHRRLAGQPRRRGAADRRRLHPRPRPPPARARWDEDRPDQARVQRDELPQPAVGHGGRAGRSAQGRLGLRPPRGQQRPRSEHQ